jgi:Rrf2 family protein
MNIPAKVDYAFRALLELASSDRALSGESLGAAQKISPAFLVNILSDLRRANLVHNRRGAQGGYQLARAAHTITAADILRAVDGPIGRVRGLPPEGAAYPGAAVHLPDLWVAARASLRNLLEAVTLADLAAGRMPAPFGALLDDDAWLADDAPQRRPPATGSREGAPLAAVSVAASVAAVPGTVAQGLGEVCTVQAVPSHTSTRVKPASAAS